MNPFSSNFLPKFAALLTTALIHFVWQGAVLTLLLLVTVKLLDVRTARLRYLLSVGTLLMMGMAPIATAILHHQGSSQPPHTPVGISARSGPVIEQHTAASVTNTAGRIESDLQKGLAVAWDPGIEVYVLIAWLAGVLILSTRLAIGFGVTLWIRANATPFSEEFEERIRTLSNRLGVDARRRVFACVRAGQAVAVGFIRPVVLIPAAWLTELTPQTIEAIIAHELAHIRRWDLWVNLVQRVIETLLFYHPAVWWLSSRIRLEREMCCDEIAAECFDRASYARSLEAVAKIGHGNLLMAVAIDGGKKMKLFNRIRYLLGLAPVDAAVNWWAVVFLTMILPFAAAIAFSLSAAAKAPDATSDKASAKSSDSAESKAIEKVVVTSPQAKSVTITQQYVCQIHAQQHIDVRAPQTGYLKAIPRQRQMVKAGDVLFEIEPVLYEPKRQAAVAEKNIAQLQLDRIQKLADERAVSQDEVKLFEAKLAKAGAAADLAEAELALTKIRAPFDGIVDRLPEQANMVKHGEVLATLSDNSLMQVYFNVPEATYLEQMSDPRQPEEAPRIELILANGKKFDQVGQFNAISADFNNETGTISYRADFPNPNRLLRHGQRGIVLITRILNDSIVIPQRATFEQLAKRYVYVVDKENVAHRREIVIQNELEDLFVIKKGVGVQDKIILKGIRRVHDGETVDYEDRAQKKG